MMAKIPSNKARLDEIDRLMQIFRPERMVHITISVVSALVLIGCAIYLVVQREYALALGLFGSTGAIAYSAGRLLKMWNDVIKILYGAEHGNE